MSALRILTGADWGMLVALLLAVGAILEVAILDWEREAIAPSSGISAIAFKIRWHLLHAAGLPLHPLWLRAIEKEKR